MTGTTDTDDDTDSAYHRHFQYCSRTHHRPKVRSSSCRNCSAAKVKCTFEPQCLRCKKKGISCVYRRADAPTNSRFNSQPQPQPQPQSNPQPQQPSPPTPSPSILSQSPVPTSPVVSSIEVEVQHLDTSEWNARPRGPALNKLPGQAGGEDNHIDWNTFLSSPTPTDNGNGRIEAATGTEPRSNSLLWTDHTQPEGLQLGNALSQSSGEEVVRGGGSTFFNSLFTPVIHEEQQGSNGDSRCQIRGGFGAPDVATHAPASLVMSERPDVDFLTRIPRNDPILQFTSSLVVQTLRAFPHMMVRRETFPSFIHAHWCSTSARGGSALPEPLVNCMGIAQMFVSRNVESSAFLWRSVRNEQRLFIQNVSHCSRALPHSQYPHMPLFPHLSEG